MTSILFPVLHDHDEAIETCLFATDKGIIHLVPVHLPVPLCLTSIHCLKSFCSADSVFLIGSYSEILIR